jgi:branched-chain amino acid transport system substrate-binding protein
LRKSYLIVTILLVIASLMLGISCSSSTPAPTTSGPAGTTAATQTLKIGAYLDLTGPVSVAGLGYKGGFQMAVDQVNEKGGWKVGNTNYKIQVLSEDCQGTPDGVTTAATKLCLQDNVKFLMGGIGDFEIPPAYKVSKEAGALLYVCLQQKAANIPESFADVGPDKPLYMHYGASMSQTDFIPVEYLKKTYPNAKNVALIGLDFPDFDYLKDQFTTELGKMGMKLTTYERIAVDAVDFNPVMTRILATKPDAIDVDRAAGNQLPIIVKAARDAGFNGPIMYAIPLDIAYAVQAGSNASDVFGLSICMTDPNLPAAVNAAIALGKQKMGNNFVSDALFAYDQLLCLGQIIEKAQSIDPATVLKTFEAMNKPGDIKSIFGNAYAGGLKTVGVNRILVRPVPLSRVVNGKAEQVAFFDMNIP